MTETFVQQQQGAGVIPGHAQQCDRHLFAGSQQHVPDAPITTGQPGFVTLAARSERWKLVLAPVAWPGFDDWTQLELGLWPNRHRSKTLRQRHYRPELYDLQADPEERGNLAGTGLEAEARLRRRVLAWVDAAEEVVPQ